MLNVAHDAEIFAVWYSFLVLVEQVGDGAQVRPVLSVGVVWKAAEEIDKVVDCVQIVVVEESVPHLIRVAEILDEHLFKLHRRKIALGRRDRERRDKLEPVYVEPSYAFHEVIFDCVDD